MNKFSEKIHYQFVSGKINGAIFEYLQKIASSVTDEEGDILLFDGHIKSLVELNVQSVGDCKEYFNIITNARNVAEALIGSISDEQSKEICKYAFNNRGRYDFSVSHNFSRLALDCINDGILKKSHPNNMGIEGEMPLHQPYDVDKWIETMRYIYDAANTNNLPLDGVAKQVTANWEENEKINFQRWMRYYQEGNYSKYNVKTAQFFSNKQDVDKTPDIKPVQDILKSPTFATPDPNSVKKQRIDEARKKLRGRLKSVEELLETYRDVIPQDTTTIMRKDVFDLKEKILSLELKASLVDSIIRTSNQFNKHGFIEGAAELRKIAQEVAEDKLPAAPAEAPPAETVEQEAMAPIPKEDSIRVPEVNIGGDTIEIPDFSSATHRDALLKLEEINKVISERNVVRALAAVDIILGQLGIASYFPSLSEAQSKLMDAFNYAGTRVAETIGQMRGGQGGPGNILEKKPEESVEVSEEVEKPVGEVMPGAPPKAPAVKPQAPPTPEVK